jgi:hypothetical protein
MSQGMGEPAGAPEDTSHAETDAAAMGARWTRRTVAYAGIGVLLAGAILAEVAIHEVRVRASEHGSVISNLVRERWGNERATQIEEIVFAYDAAFVTAWSWAADAIVEEPEAPPRVVARAEDDEPAIDLPDASLTSFVQQRPSLVLPPIVAVTDTPRNDEGYWSTEGLPNPSATDIVIAETRVRPRKLMPRATVHVLLFDTDRVSLRLVGGKRSPGADRGVVGPGVIPVADRPQLLAAWNGGFQGTHAPDYGMFADGREYRPLKNGLASLVVMDDGEVRLGQWGRDFTTRTEDMVAVRQNSVLLVDDGEISPRINESVEFGLVNIGDTVNFITWRSAIGVTEDGDLLVATGDYVTQEHMAQAMRAVGAEYAMLLDNNLPYVQTVLATHGEDGALALTNTRSFMSASPNRYLAGGYAYDFMYLTLLP